MTDSRLGPADPAPFDLAGFLRQPLPDHPMDDDPDYLDGYDPALPPPEPNTAEP